jgi:uncharacterized membrane protein
MKLFHDIVEVISLVVSAAGVLVVIWGTAEGVYRFLVLKLTGGSRQSLCRDQNIRQDLGAHLLLGLEIFIAADIISSVASPTWEKVGILGAIVVIRTLLSFFLYLEVKGDMGVPPKPDAEAVVKPDTGTKSST